jgi:sporulation protein YqfC
VEHYLVKQKNADSVTVEGVRLLAEFSDELVVVTVNSARISVGGQKLKIVRFDENEIEITGKIGNVETITSRKRAL